MQKSLEKGGDDWTTIQTIKEKIEKETNQVAISQTYGMLNLLLHKSTEDDPINSETHAN